MCIAEQRNASGREPNAPNISINAAPRNHLIVVAIVTVVVPVVVTFPVVAVVVTLAYIPNITVAAIFCA
jgi:hypothetical protein